VIFNRLPITTVNVKSAYRVPNRQLNIAVYGISVYRCITTIVPSGYAVRGLKKKKKPKNQQVFKQ
jgi:hypothetical protein